MNFQLQFSLIIMIILPFKAYAQWYEIQNPGNSHLKNLHFLNGREGLVTLGSKTMVKTYDSGMTWDTVLADLGSFYQLHFINDSTGFLLCSKPSTREILKTTDRGNSWISIIDETKVGSFKGFRFLNDSLGFVVGFVNNKWSVRRTKDGGQTWDANNLPVNMQGPYFDQFVFFDDKRGYVFGSGPGLSQFYTLDGGDSWLPYWQGGIYFYSFPTATRGFIDDGDFIWPTDDAGTSWTKLEFNNIIGSISCPSADTCFAGGLSYTYKTYDAGETWQWMYMKCNSFDLLHCPTNDTCYAFCTQSTIRRLYRTFNGGDGETILLDLEDHREVSQFTMSPNPARGQVWVGLSEALVSEASSLVLYDRMGRQVWQQLYNGGDTISIDLYAFPPGMYLLQIQGRDGRRWTEKLMVN